MPSSRMRFTGIEPMVVAIATLPLASTARICTSHFDSAFMDSVSACESVTLTFVIGSSPDSSSTTVKSSPVLTIVLHPTLNARWIDMSVISALTFAVMVGVVPRRMVTP